MNNRSYNSEIAKKYGVIAGTILSNIYFWVEYNATNGINFYDGRFWTYNAMKAFELQFEEFSAKQIRTALKKMAEDCLIYEGNYNKTKYDRTTWYTINIDMYEELIKSSVSFKENINEKDKTERYCGFIGMPDFDNTILPNGQMEKTEWSNGKTQTVKPIPDINKNIKKDNLINLVMDENQKVKSDEENTRQVEVNKVTFAFFEDEEREEKTKTIDERNFLRGVERGRGLEATNNQLKAIDHMLESCKNSGNISKSEVKTWILYQVIETNEFEYKDFHDCLRIIKRLIEENRYSVPIGFKSRENQSETLAKHHEMEHVTS